MRTTVGYCEARVAPYSIYAVLNRECFTLFPDELFADLFTDVGRRSVPPIANDGLVSTAVPARAVLAGLRSHVGAVPRLGRRSVRGEHHPADHAVISKSWSTLSKNARMSKSSTQSFRRADAPAACPGRAFVDS